MAMQVREFMDRLNQVRAAVKAGEATEEMATKLGQLTERLRSSHSPEELKAAMSSDSEIATDLEEGMTTLYMLFVQRRGLG